MSLEDWLKNDWLHAHRATPEELRKLLLAADRDLTDCQSESISADWRFNIAYNAALQVSMLALAAEGYRAQRELNHYRSLQSLRYTLGIETSILAKLDSFRKKRNIGAYQEVGAVSDKELREMIALATSLREQVSNWLREKFPEVLNKDP